MRQSKFSQLDLLPDNNQPVPLAPVDALREVPLVFGSWGVGVYSDLIDFLTSKLGVLSSDKTLFGKLDEGETLFVFYYDWRCSNFANAKALNDFISKEIPNGEYDIIAHSMGGLVTRIMLSGERPDSPCFNGERNGLDEVDYAASVWLGTL